MMYSNNSLVPQSQQPQQQQQSQQVSSPNDLISLNNQYHQMHSFSQPAISHHQSYHHQQPSHHHHHHQQQQQHHHQSQQQMSSLSGIVDTGVGLLNGGSAIAKLEPTLNIPEIDKEKEKQARENHCEIERRRRVKMAAYFNELCVMVPTCNTLQRKPDKLTILRMASTHMRNLRGNHTNSILANDNAYKPSFLTDQELKHLILEAADGFLFVSQCDTGNIIYVSDAVQSVLAYSPNEWTHRSLFEFVHPDDLNKVKDQLSTQENSSNNTNGRILDLKTGTVKKEGHPNSIRSHIGSRRSFVCRIKLGHQISHQHNRHLLDAANSANIPGGGFWSSSNPRINRTCLQSSLSSDDYTVVHITGYTKIWPPNSSVSGSSAAATGTSMSMLDHSASQKNMYQPMDDPANNAGNNNFHLIAIARIQMTSAPNDLVNSTNAEFITRHDQNGICTFADQRVTALIGYQPNDLLKKSIFDFVIPQDQQMFKDQLKTIYESKITQPVQMTIHFVSAPDTGGAAGVPEIVPFTTSAYAFCNPCNDAFEFIVCTHLSQNYNETSNKMCNGINQQLAHTSTSSSSVTSPSTVPSSLLGTHIDPSNGYYNLSQSQYNSANSSGFQHHPNGSSNNQLNYQSQFMQVNQPFQTAQTHMNQHQQHGNYLIMPSN